MASLVSYNTDVVFHYLDTVEHNREFQMHYHDIYELYYFVEGEADYFVEGKQYRLKPDSLLLLAPHTIHGVRVNSVERYKRYTIHFDPKLIDPQHRAFLLSVFSDSEASGPQEVCYTNLRKFDLYPFLDTLINCNNLPMSLSEKLRSFYIEALLAKLAEIHHSFHHPAESAPLFTKVVPIINYINGNLTAYMTLEMLCEQFYISKIHLNRLFKKYVGTTPFEYITYRRSALAQHLLQKGIPAKDVARQIGYRDYSAFFRTYKKITGRTPTQENANSQE